MNGCENNFEGWREERHSELWAARHSRKEVGLAVKIVSDGFLVDGRRDNCLERPRKGLLSSGFQICKRPLSGLATALPELNAGCVTAQIVNKQHRFVGRLGRVADPLVFYSGGKLRAVPFEHGAVRKQYPSGQWQGCRDRFKNDFKTNSARVAGGDPDRRAHEGDRRVAISRRPCPRFPCTCT